MKLRVQKRHGIFWVTSNLWEGLTDLIIKDVNIVKAKQKYYEYTLMEMSEVPIQARIRHVTLTRYESCLGFAHFHWISWLQHCKRHAHNRDRVDPVASTLKSNWTGCCCHVSSVQTVKLTYKQTPWLKSSSELYRLSDRRLSAKLVPTLADRGCRVVSAANPPRPLNSVS
jgi:hypothetical protein